MRPYRLIPLLILASCSTATGRIAGAEASLTFAERLAHGYVSLPSCKSEVSLKCFDQSKREDIKKAKTAAENAFSLARATQNHSNIALAETAIKAFQAIIPEYVGAPK